MALDGCTCFYSELNDVWTDPGDCEVHAKYNHKGEIAWWVWPDYDGYPPDTGVLTSALDEETGTSTILPADTVAEWHQASGVIRTGAYVGKASMSGHVKPVTRPEMAIGVALTDGVAGDEVLVALAGSFTTTLYAVRYVVPPERIPDKPVRRRR